MNFGCPVDMLLGYIMQNCLQTVQTLIRLLIRSSLIQVYTVCLLRHHYLNIKIDML